MPDSGTLGKEGKMEKEKIFQVKLNLTENDWKRFWQQAAVYGTTPGEMLERFIDDVAWQHTKAMEWCGETFWENEDTFLGYLCQYGCVDILEDMKNTKNNIAGIKEQMDGGFRNCGKNFKKAARTIQEPMKRKWKRRMYGRKNT